MKFAEFYTQRLINESINDVPRSVLGMSTSVVDLPDTQPYGFWVDRSGNFLRVGYQQHIEGLTSIVNKAKQFLHKQNVNYEPKYRYVDLLDIGWMRVVIGNSSVMYQMKSGQPATTAQLRFVKTLQEMYDKPYIVDDTNN
jgi:hypothetical protein